MSFLLFKTPTCSYNLQTPLPLIILRHSTRVNKPEQSEQKLWNTQQRRKKDGREARHVVHHVHRCRRDNASPRDRGLGHQEVQLLRPAMTRMHAKCRGTVTPIAMQAASLYVQKKAERWKKIHSSSYLFGHEISLEPHLVLIESMVFICVRTDKLNRKLKWASKTLLLAYFRPPT